MPTAKRKGPKPLNLLPQNQFEQTLFGTILKWILTSFRVIVISVELVVISGFLTRFWLDIEHSDLNDEITQKEILIGSYLPFEQEFKLTQTRLKIFSFITAENTQGSPTLNKIIERLPPDIRLTSFIKQPHQVEISGTCTSEQSIAQFIANLKADPEFTAIGISSLENLEDSNIIAFTLISIPI